MVWVATFVLYLALFNPIKAGRRGNADSYVQEFNVQSDCKAHIKNVRSLKTGAAVFYFNELTSNSLSRANYDFDCHYELEAPRDFGFHVYFDHMDLSENTLNTEPCTDFVQFGRDILFVDSHRSQKFCGKRTTPVNNGSSLAFSGGQGTRFYVEETDREMDLWIKISKRTPTFKPSPRRLKITVTVIKKDCGVHNPYYRQCSHTDHCIRREFFCDGRINCAWPDAEHGGTDEVNCDAEDEPYRGPFNSRGASNIPLVIVMIIIATAFIVVMVIFGKKFFVVFCKNNELRRQSTPSSTQSNELPPSNRRLPRPAVAASVVLPAEPNEHTPALAATSSDDAPSAPPSYEEVIKDNPGILSRGVPLAPPSYSESQSMTTTQV